MFISAYLRASTEEQDASRAQASLEQFASDHNKVIASVYLENARGAAADRPELLRLLKDARKGDCCWLNPSTVSHVYRWMTG